MCKGERKAVNKGEKLREGGITCIGRLKEKAEELIAKSHADPVREFMAFVCRTPESGRALTEHFLEIIKKEMEQRHAVRPQASGNHRLGQQFPPNQRGATGMHFG